MASYEPFGHFQHKLCAKEGLGVKLVIWLLTTKSRESTRPRCVQVECNKPLESSQGELQVFFRPHPNRRFKQGVMNCQSYGSANQDNFGTPPWESREKVPFKCRCNKVTQRILCGGRRWLPRVWAVVSLVSPKSPVVRPSTKGAPESELTNLCWLDAGPSN
jgi:hypothetical protein